MESQAPTSSDETPESESAAVPVPVTESGAVTESVAASEPVAESVTVPVTESGAVAESVTEPAAVTESVTESESVTAEADTVAGEVVTAEAQADTVTGVAAPDLGTESSVGDLEAEGAGKKKRRRRRKKKGAQAGASDAPPDAKSAHHHAPFLHLFSAGATRKHAFSVGEEIAGRVERVEHGTVIVDLFGKATAIADVDEPREIPIIIHEAEAISVEVPSPEAEEQPPRPEDAADASGGEEAPAPIHTPLVPSPAAIPTPMIEAPTAQMAKLAQDDASAWEFSPTEVTDVPDDELGEADTVVAPAA